MSNYILETYGGETFQKVAEKAQQIAIAYDTVDFDFNGIKCIVSANTNLEWLYRDYSNAFLMDWKTIGPDCVAEYDDDTLIELGLRAKAAEERAEAQRLEWEENDKKERKAFEAKTQGIDIELSDADEWNSWRSNNTDSYGDCIFQYAESWAKLMQVEMAAGKPLAECAEYTSHELGFYGITGFMYGAAVAILSKCWKHGEELRKWHNKEYNHEGEGVVNPALLTITA